MSESAAPAITPNATSQSWPLYVLPNPLGQERVSLGEIVHHGRWELRQHYPDFAAIAHGEFLQTLADMWLSELGAEVAAANGASNGVDPISPGRLEWRRVLHNNNLRIGPAQAAAD